MILAAAKDNERGDAVVEQGYDLAQAYGVDLEVLTVMPQEAFEERWRSENDYYTDKAAEDAARLARNVVNRTLSDAKGVTVNGRVGEPVTEILEEANHIDAKYIVISGRKRSPAGKALFGSTTQSLLLSADRPIVAVMQK